MSPKSKEQFQKIRDKRKEEILSVALQLFASQGYHNTSVSQIALKTGISKGLLYNYFQNKKDLLIQVSIYTIEQTANTIFSILKNPDDPLSPTGKITKGIDLYFEMLRRQAHLWKLSMSLALQVSDIPEIQQLMHQTFQRFFDEIEQMLRAAKTPGAKGKAKLLSAQLDGIALHYFALGEQYDLDSIKQELLNSIQNHK